MDNYNCFTISKMAKIAKLTTYLLGTLVLSGCGTSALNPIEASQIKPVVFGRLIPLSKSIQAGVDFTPTVAGAIINMANTARMVRQANSDKFRLITIYPLKPLLEKNDVCYGHSIEVDMTDKLAALKPGDHVRLKKGGDGGTVLENVFLPDGTASTIQENDYCYSFFVANFK